MIFTNVSQTWREVWNLPGEWFCLALQMFQVIHITRTIFANITAISTITIYKCFKWLPSPSLFLSSSPNISSINIPSTNTNIITSNTNTWHHLNIIFHPSNGITIVFFVVFCDLELFFQRCYNCGGDLSKQKWVIIWTAFLWCWQHYDYGHSMLIAHECYSDGTYISITHIRYAYERGCLMCELCLASKVKKILLRIFLSNLLSFPFSFEDRKSVV